MEEKIKSSKTKKTLIISLCVITLVFVCILGTYAYLLTNINNDDKQQAELNTGTMHLRFADGDSTINKQIMLGETITKEFTLENKGTLDAGASIEWLDIVNGYMEGSLTYTLEQSETKDSGYTEIIEKTNVPVTKTAFTTTLAPDLEVPAGKTYYYNLKITFNDLPTIDQSADANAALYTKFGVSETSENRSYSLTIDLNGGKLNGVSTVEDVSIKNGVTREIGTPRKAGSKFVGWKIIGMGSTLTDGILIMGKANTKLIAEYEEGSASEILSKLGVEPIEVTDTVPDFSAATTSNEAGVYSMEDDYGTSYFYRGAVTNNYVKFAGLYWRIIRVNGDGSVRIRYDGTSAHANGTNTTNRFTHTGQAYNANSNDAKYVGWMYGPAGTGISTSKEEAQTNTANSDIKTLVDGWYKTNIVDAGYSESVEDTIFCNDRSTPGSGKYGTANSTYYLYNPAAWSWSLSPCNYNSRANEFILNTSGDLNYANVHSPDGAVAPVINLSSEYFKTLKGTGSMSDPFRAE